MSGLILVIGGRSKIGSALLHTLATRGDAVRALVRAEERLAPLPPAVEAVRGDLADPTSLDAALDGVEKVFLICGPTPQQVQYNRNAIDAAQRAGLRLMVRSAILGADPAAETVFRRDHGQSDDYLAASGVPHRIVRPNLFLQKENTIPASVPTGTSTPTQPTPG